jgi:glycosyltransferase involved in cell wall biosynthesis
MEPVVSICCLTYNHILYIRQCLDGFMMQKINFPIEILIYDDASTDGTQGIIREYEKKYPDIIKPIYQKENQYSKGIKVSLVYNYSRAKGKYIALCEGDDYWTDPYKLQKQVDFLESHPDYVMCSHRFNQYIQEKELLEEEQDKDFKGADYDLKNLIGGKWLTQTLTVMYRRSALDLKRYAAYGMSMDMILFYELLRNGKGYCFPDIMAVYRLHNGGVWSEVSLNTRRLVEFKARLAIYKVEKSDDAATFILYQFAKAMSRIWMLKQWRMFLNVIGILKKHYGNAFVTRLMFDKLVFGKGIRWGDVSNVKCIVHKDN